MFFLLKCIAIDITWAWPNKNERGNIIPDPKVIKMITGEYYKQLCALKFNKLDEMDQFLNRQKLPTLNKVNLFYQEQTIGKE